MLRTILRPSVTQCLKRQLPVMSSVRHSTDSKPSTKAVIFDIGGVLIPNPYDLFQEFENVNKLSPGTVMNVLRESHPDGSWFRLERGEISLEDFGKPFSEECSKKAGRQVDASWILPRFLETHTAPYPEMIEAVKCVRAEGLKTAVITNNFGFKDGRNMFPDEFMSLFDVFVESYKVGARKPEFEPFRVCLEKLGVTAEESIFLDDHHIHCKAARGYGFRAIQVSDRQVALNELSELLGFDCRAFIEGTILVPERLRIPLDKLKSYLNWALKLHAKGEDKPLVRCYEHGQSNPTYFVRYGGKDMVLRKKPPGKLLPSAHAVEREFRVMKAVKEFGVPVPKMLGLCEDSSLLGTPFYIMEHCPGRVFKDPELVDCKFEERRLIFTAMIDTLCRIHSVDVSAAKLDDYGKQGPFIQRNVARWKKQYEASKTHDIPVFDRLITWLEDNLPKNERICLTHGDFRIDNLIYHPHRPDVVATIDWELSTLGNPLVDLASALFMYCIPTNYPILSGIKDLDYAAHGIPTVDQLVNEYCQKMGIPLIYDLPYYLAFTCFKLAAIVQGVYKRSLAGQASSSTAESVGKAAEFTAQLGWDIASQWEAERAQATGNTSTTQATGNTDIGSRHYSTVSKNNTAAMSTNSQPANTLLPTSVTDLNPRAQELHARVKAFINEHILPLEQDFIQHSSSDRKWTIMPVVETLKAKAKSEGLWNLFLPLESDPGCKFGAGLTNVEYAMMCEEMGRCPISSEIFNCSAPDTGNMEVLVKYGTPEQQEKWLSPLLDGKIRSCFGMTEPAVASSDATNIESSIVRDGDSYVINGHKWWTSGAMDPRCKVCIFMGKTDTSAPIHKQQSMILVPMDAPGVKILRPLSVFGSEDAPHGHAEVLFENVRVPLGNMLLGEGRGFEIAQGRLGPGRIHHCMRLIGNAERALELMVDRTKKREAFGKPLARYATIQQDVANSRIEIEQSRLLVLKAAHMMDTVGNKVAAPEIAMIKVSVPNMACKVIDRAIQAFGGAGFHHDVPLSALYAWARVLRMADGPDEVHLRSIARMEYKKSMSKL